MSGDSRDALYSIPHSESAEASLLGALMLSPKTWDEVAGIVAAEDFYRETHRLIFEAVAFLSSRGEATDPVSVFERMRVSGKADRTDNGALLIEMANECPGITSATGWAKIVRERADLRRVLTSAQVMSAMARDLDPVEEILEYVGQSFASVGDRVGALTMAEALAAREKDIEEHSRGASRAIHLPIPDVDRVIGPWMPSDLIILAARPSMGKTAAAIQLALAMARGGVAVLFLSIEMDRNQIILRAAHHLTGRPFPRDVTQWNDSHRSRYAGARSTLASLPIWIDDRSDVSPTSLRARVRSWAAKMETQGYHRRLVVVDYIQLMQPSHRSQSRYESVSEASRTAKQVAKESGCSCLILSQLSRSIETRPSGKRRPMNSDLRETGQLEQDADIIVFLHSDAYYEGARPPRELVEWVATKNRHGSTGDPLTVWVADKQLFLPADPADAAALEQSRDSGPKGGPY